MEFKPICLEHKEVYEAFYKKLYRQSSDTSFTTPYIWSPSMQSRLFVSEDILCVQGRTSAGHPFYMMPQGDGDKEAFLRLLYEKCKDVSIPFSLRWILREELPLVQKVFGEKLTISSVRDGADYIYKTESLCTLKGKKLHGKRNHVNAFKSQYAYKTEEITESTLPMARAFVLEHCRTKEEAAAMEKLFAAYFDLGLCGMLLYAGDTLCAVTCGERINEDTALIHLEKGDTAFSGVYPAVNQLFIQTFFSDTQFINREEDMGIEGLRKAKLSYHPAYLLEKFNACEAK